MRKKHLLPLTLVTSIFVFGQAGNVGVGTTSPTNKLTVNGNASIGTNYLNYPAPANGSIIEGNVGIGTNNPQNTLHIRKAVTGSTPNVVALFDPAGGGSDATEEVSIGLNGGRGLFGYTYADRKYTFLRGNQGTDVRLQVVDNSNVLAPDTFVISAENGSVGYIGVNNALPQSRIDLRGGMKVFPITGTQTGVTWTGTSNMSGFEIATTPAGDAWTAIQRAGTGAPLHIAKPEGTTTGNMIIFNINGVPVGSITHTASSVAYNTTSDLRLKENIKKSKYGLQTLNNIEIFDYNYKSDKTKELNTGVLAQKLYEIYPQAVTSGGENEKTNPWQVDYSKLVPLLIKSVQELTDKVEKLESELKGLKLKVN